MNRNTTATRTHSSRRDSRGAQAGFSLVEMLVVLALIGLVTALIGPQVVGYLGGAKEDAARAEIANLETSLDLFKLDVGRYPNEREGLTALVQPPSGVARWHGPYLQHGRLPADPWGRPYVYRVSSKDGRYDLFSRGPDGNTGDAAPRPAGDTRDE